MNNRRKKEEMIYDFLFTKLGARRTSEEDPESYIDEDGGRTYYKRIILISDYIEFEELIKKIEYNTKGEYVKEYNYLSLNHYMDDCLMVFRNIQTMEFIKTIEVLISYTIDKKEQRSDCIEELLS